MFFVRLALVTRTTNHLSQQHRRSRFAESHTASATRVPARRVSLRVLGFRLSGGDHYPHRVGGPTTSSYPPHRCRESHHRVFPGMRGAAHTGLASLPPTQHGYTVLPHRPQSLTSFPRSSQSIRLIIPSRPGPLPVFRRGRGKQVPNDQPRQESRAASPACGSEEGAFAEPHD